MYCKYCGKALNGDEKFCPGCGRAVGTDQTNAGSSQTNNQSTAEQKINDEYFKGQNPPESACPRCGQKLRPGDDHCPFCSYVIKKRKVHGMPFYIPDGEKKGLGFGIASIIIGVLSPLLAALFYLLYFLPYSASLLPTALSVAFGIIAIYQGKRSNSKSAIVTGIVGICLAAVTLIFMIVVFVIFINIIFTERGVY